MIRSGSPTGLEPSDPPGETVATEPAAHGAEDDARKTPDAAGAQKAAERPMPEPSERALVAASSVFIGALVVASTNAVAIAATVPWPRGGVLVRLAHHAADVAHLVSLGALGAALVGGWARFVSAPPWLSFVACAGGSAVVVHAILARDLMRQALVALEGRLTLPLFWTFVVLSGVAVPTAYLVGATFARWRRLWLLPVLASLGGIVAHHAYARDDYPGFHAGISWAAAVLSGSTLAPKVLPSVRAWLAHRRWARIASAAAVVASLVATAWPAPNWLRRELFREPGAIGAWALAATLWSPPPTPVVEPPDSPWFCDRSGLPDVPPTEPRLFQGPPVVVLVTIDALRADVLERRDLEKRLPVLTRLKQSGVWFTHVTSPGSQTAVSLTTTFAGRYFSQMRWGMFGEGSGRFAYAAADPTPRFPELLSAAGIPTVTYTSLLFLGDEFGVIRGFAERRMIAQGRRHAFGKDVVDPVIARLRSHGVGPLFLYAHLMEPHHPYDRGDTNGSEWDRYVSEVALADQLLGRIEQVVRQRFGRRGVLIVAADHGEAFGEHDTRQHTKTLYEELLRVPLIVYAPVVARRTIDQHVGLVDLGPTILDIFGLPTPSWWMGQSLVPLLAGRDVELDRPLLAEGRLRRALYWNGLKVIEDERRTVVEVFDLERDPGELDDLWDTDRPRAAEALAVLRSFFAVHALSVKDPSYVPPFKP